MSTALGYHVDVVGIARLRREENISKTGDQRQRTSKTKRGDKVISRQLLCERSERIGEKQISKRMTALSNKWAHVGHYFSRRCPTNELGIWLIGHTRNCATWDVYVAIHIWHTVI